MFTCFQTQTYQWTFTKQVPAWPFQDFYFTCTISVIYMLFYELLTFRVPLKQKHAWTLLKKLLFFLQEKTQYYFNVIFIKPTVQNDSSFIHTIVYFFRCCLSRLWALLKHCRLSGWCVCTECDNIMLIYNIKRWIHPNLLVVNTDCLNSVWSIFFGIED